MYKQIVFTIALIFALLVMAAVHTVGVMDQTVWQRYFATVRSSFDFCKIEIMLWPGNHQDALNRAVLSTPVTLPLRGQTDYNRVTNDKVQIIQCDINLAGIAPADFSWISLGRLYGDTMVFWNHMPIAATASGDRVEFPTPPQDHGKNSNLVSIVSRGDATGAVGPWTLIPPYHTTDRATHAKLTRYIRAIYGERPILQLGLISIVVILLLVVWYAKFNYWDIAWLLVYLAALALQNLAIYALNFYPSFVDASSRWQGATMLCQLIALAVFLSYFARRQARPHSIATTALVAITIAALAYMLVPAEWYFYLRMKVQLPLALGALLFFGVCFRLLKRSKAIVLPLEHRRHLTASVMAGVVGLVLVISYVLDERFDINLIATVQEIILIIFVVVLFIDLAKRHRSYYEVRTSQLNDRNRREFQDDALRQIAYIVHDISKPLARLNSLSSSTVQTVSPQEFNGELAYLHSLVQQMSHVAYATTPMADEQVAVRQCFADALADVRLQYPGRSCTCHCNVPIDFVISMGRNDLRRIFSNLIDNAFTATSGTFELFLEVKQEPQLTTITVANTGSFIPRDQIAKIFEFGFSSKGDQIGHGLGLAYCSEVMTNRYGGTINCSSNSERTSFELKFPAVGHANRDSLGRHLIVIDDDPATLMMWKWELKGGAEVFANVREFTGYWSKLTPAEQQQAIVVTDMTLDNDRAAGLLIAQMVKQSASEATVLLASYVKLNETTHSPLFKKQIGKKIYDRKSLVAMANN